MKAKIIGYGVSGKAAESYLVARNVETVVVADAQEKVADDYDFCVVSPGVPMTQLHENVPVVPEVELPFYCEPKLKPRSLVAVTGTNGKTTVVKQIYQMCQASGKKSVLCGNVGVPVTRVAKQLHQALVVMEVSSFMLEQTKILHPHIAVLTNITADHLDRHVTMENYAQCKAQITTQQTRKDWFVVNYDDVNARRVGEDIMRKHGPRVLWYSTQTAVTGYYIQDGKVLEKLGRRVRILGAVDELGGMPHTVSNALSVIAVGRLLKIPLATIWRACRYQPQFHRMELVIDHQGVAFYNDSKATNMAATLAATRSIQMPICLILCGLSKGQDYHELLRQLPSNVEQVLVFGAIKEQVMTVAQSLGLQHVVAVTDLATAVKRAAQVVKKPGVVLFSPSGSSFDMFANYEQRGDEFKHLVLATVKQEPQYSHLTDADL